ncbi:MAG: type II secretion system protein N [Alphaproteobacteria bacterium]|nr:type II secretion system protein N [Alphaproteobacteria bacterium]
MRTLILTLVFVLALIAGLVAFTPLGFVLERSGLARTGAGWAQVEGTIMQGRISGLHVSGQPVGDVNLKLRPISLLTLSPQYDVQWGGAGGSGSGLITMTQNSLLAEELRLQQNISSIEGLALPVRAIGGTVRLTGASIKLTRTGCERAAGTITTDVLSRFAQQYGRQFGAVQGPLACKNGEVVADLEGRSERGDRLSVAARGSLLGSAVFDAVIETRDTEVMLALSQTEFQRDGDSWRYHYETTGGIGQ